MSRDPSKLPIINKVGDIFCYYNGNRGRLDPKEAITVNLDSTGEYRYYSTEDYSPKNFVSIAKQQSFGPFEFIDNDGKEILNNHFEFS